MGENKMEKEVVAPDPETDGSDVDLQGFVV